MEGNALYHHHAVIRINPYLAFLIVTLFASFCAFIIINYANKVLEAPSFNWTAPGHIQAVTDGTTPN